MERESRGKDKGRDEEAVNSQRDQNRRQREEIWNTRLK